MVIDDSRAIRLILGKMLKELGFEVIDAENGAVAMERLKTSEKLDIAN